MRQWTTALRRGFIALSVVWAAALPLATWQSGFLALGVYAIGAAVCHQLPDRSFHLWHRQMAVCARCTGIYVGAAIAAVVVALVRRKGSRRRSPAFRASFGARARSSALLVAGLAPNVATVIFEWTTGITPANWIRAAAGLALGAAVATVVIYEVN